MNCSSVALLQFIFYCFYSPISSATQPQELEAWEMEHHSFSDEARSLMRIRCEEEAKEIIYEPAENIKSVFRKTENGGHSYIDAPTTLSGVSLSHPNHMYFRLGLELIEFETSEIRPPFQRLNNPTNQIYGRFNLRTRKDESINHIESRYTLKFIGITNPHEESLGIRGREILVIDEVENKTLARRTEFFWISPYLKDGDTQGGFICPTLKYGEKSPQSFLSKVINPKSYACWKRHESNLHKLYKGRNQITYHPNESNRLIEEINNCDKEYWNQSNEDPLVNKLQ